MRKRFSPASSQFFSTLELSSFLKSSSFTFELYQPGEFLNAYFFIPLQKCSTIESNDSHFSFIAFLSIITDSGVLSWKRIYSRKTTKLYIEVEKKLQRILESSPSRANHKKSGIRCCSQQPIHLSSYTVYTSPR